jgi:curved DNA-binding protein CbpA
MHSSLLPYSPERDAYLLLGVPSTASSDEVSAACRRLARTFHPDRNGSTRATAEMAVVNAVRRLMIDPEARAEYDRERRSYHERRARAIAYGPAEWRPLISPIEPGGSPPRAGLRRYFAGVVAGLSTAARALAPPRCRGCRAVIASGDDAYCAACGTPLLSGG